MRILCLFVRHGLGRYPEALAQLDAWYARHGLLAQRRLWILDNSLPPGTPPRELSPGVELRAGDNQTWEFSAWGAAIETARAAPDVDVVHFVTSAFHTLYVGYLDHFRPEMLGFVAERRVCLGHIDSYPTPITLRGQASDAWIRTCFFFLAHEAALAPRPWAAFRDEAEVFTDSAGRTFRPDAPLSPDYRERITHWLEGREQGGHVWHSAVASGAEESRRFRQKTLAILNEHQLAIQLRREAITLVDFCWLHTLPAESLARSDLGIESEAGQLRVRRRCLGIPE